MTAPLFIRPAAAADLERIAWLEETAFADPWSPPLLQGELVFPGAVLLVASRGATPAAGYACFRRAGDEAELLRVAVAPEARGHGIATALVCAGLERLRRTGARRCLLEVRPDNAGAIAVYHRVGFTRVGSRRAYYRDGSDALIFALELAGPAPPGGDAGGSRGT